MKEHIKQEKLKPFQPLTTPDRIFSYITLRNLNIPVLIQTRGNNKILLQCIFSNTTLEFTTTNKKTAYIDSIQFIEEMNDEYNTEPKKEYTITVL